MGGIEKLKDHVDTLIIIPNDQLLAEVQDRSTSLNDAFKLADTVLLQVGAAGRMRSRHPSGPCVLSCCHEGVAVAVVRALILLLGWACAWVVFVCKQVTWFGTTNSLLQK